MRSRFATISLSREGSIFVEIWFTIFISNSLIKFLCLFSVLDNQGPWIYYSFRLLFASNWSLIFLASLNNYFLLTVFPWYFLILSINRLVNVMNFLDFDPGFDFLISFGTLWCFSSSVEDIADYGMRQLLI